MERSISDSGNSTHKCHRMREQEGAPKGLYGWRRGGDTVMGDGTEKATGA